MSEAWRKKTFYDKRVLIETERVITSSFPSVLICLTGTELEMLRNITQYLHRRSSFAANYSKTGYLSPTNEEWDTIEALVAELEEKLMSDCLIDLIAAVNSLTSVQSAMMTCICQMSDWQRSLAGRLPDLVPYVDNNDVTYETPASTQHAPVEPGSDEEKCEFAQAVFYYTYQLYTETLLPFANSTSDTLVALIVAAAPFGAIAGWVGVPVAILAALVLGLVAWGVAGSAANFANWMWDNKGEMICILYNHFPDYTTSAAELREYIDDAETLSFLDKQVLKTVMGSAWHYSWIVKDQALNGTWDASFIEGQCDLCVLVPDECQTFAPCNLDDWDSSPEATIVCNGQYPQVKTGYHTYTEPDTEILGYDMWVKIHWIPRGESTHATADFDVMVGEDQETQIALYPTSSKPIDVLTSDTYSFVYDGVGTPVSIRAIQAVWWFDVVWMCFYDHDPDV
jgi:hypothetical protein